MSAVETGQTVVRRLTSIERRARREGMLEISNPSRELQFKALETFPEELSPSFWDGKFFFDSPWRGGKLDLEAYLKRTAVGNIAPFTTLKLVYDNASWSLKPAKLVVSVPEEVSHVSYNSEDNEKREKAARLIAIANREILQGRSPNKIEFDCSHSYHPEKGFRDFKENFLPFLKVRSYDIDNVDLWITSFESGSHYSGGTFPGAELQVRASGITISGLRQDLFRGELTSEQRAKAVDWFASLKQLSGLK